MAAGFVNTTIYVGPSTTISQSIWDTVGDGTGNKIPGFLLRDSAGNVQPSGDAPGRSIYSLSNPAVVASANFTRPADTTAYASGDLVANSTTAGSVTPLAFTAARTTAGGGYVRRARLKKSTNTTANASFRLHLYTSAPTCANGDNGGWSTTHSGYVGSIDLDASGTSGRVFTDPAVAVQASPGIGSEINYVLPATTLYGLLEARAAYTPGSAEVVTVELETYQF